MQVERHAMVSLLARQHMVEQHRGAAVLLNLLLLILNRLVQHVAQDQVVVRVVLHVRSKVIAVLVVGAHRNSAVEERRRRETRLNVDVRAREVVLFLHVLLRLDAEDVLIGRQVQHGAGQRNVAEVGDRVVGEAASKTLNILRKDSLGRQLIVLLCRVCLLHLLFGGPNVLHEDTLQGVRVHAHHVVLLLLRGARQIRGVIEKLSKAAGGHGAKPRGHHGRKGTTVVVVVVKTSDLFVFFKRRHAVCSVASIIALVASVL